MRQIINPIPIPKQIGKKPRTYVLGLMARDLGLKPELQASACGFNPNSFHLDLFMNINQGISLCMQNNIKINYQFIEADKLIKYIVY